jgi:predicted secreted protein
MTLRLRRFLHGLPITSARRVLLSLVIYIIALICLQCCLSPSGISEAKIVIVTKEDAGKSVEIARGDIIQLELSGTPTTGFWWRFTDLDKTYLDLVKEATREISSRQLDGAPIMGIWQLRAKQAGTTAIAMAYYRTWEGMAKARGWFHLTVQIR